MRISQVPIIGSVVEGVSAYAKISREIISQNKSFVKNRLPLTDETFGVSMRYFEYGLGASILFSVPFFVLHGQSITKSIFVLQQVVAIFTYNFFILVAFKITKSAKPTFTELTTVMGFLWGFLFISNFILALPIMMFIGPDFMFRGLDNSWAHQVDANQLLFFSVFSSIGGLIFLGIWLYLILNWLSDLLGITKWNVFWPLLIGGVPSGVINGFALGPIFRSIEVVLGDWLIAL